MLYQYCRCCGKEFVNIFDNAPIHTTCIPKHWSKHARGINTARCYEFALSARKTD